MATRETLRLRAERTNAAAERAKDAYHRALDLAKHAAAEAADAVASVNPDVDIDVLLRAAEEAASKRDRRKFAFEALDRVADRANAAYDAELLSGPSPRDTARRAAEAAREAEVWAKWRAANAAANAASAPDAIPVDVATADAALQLARERARSTHLRATGAAAAAAAADAAYDAAYHAAMRGDSDAGSETVTNAMRDRTLKAGRDARDAESDAAAAAESLRFAEATAADAHAYASDPDAYFRQRAEHAARRSEAAARSIQRSEEYGRELEEGLHNRPPLKTPPPTDGARRFGANVGGAAAAAAEHARDRYVVFPYDDEHDSPQWWQNIIMSMMDIVRGDVRTVEDLRVSMARYNTGAITTTSLSNLEMVLTTKMSDPLAHANFFDVTLPNIARLVIETQVLFSPGRRVDHSSHIDGLDDALEIVKDQVPLLRAGEARTVSVTRRQAACIVANAFLSTWPGRRVPTTRPRARGDLPSINFVNSGLLSLARVAAAERPSHTEKLFCFVQYLERWRGDRFAGANIISFERRQAPLLFQGRWWSKSDGNRTVEDLWESTAASNRGKISAANFVFIDDSGGVGGGAATIDTAQYSDAVRNLRKTALHTDRLSMQRDFAPTDGSYTFALPRARVAEQFSEDVVFASAGIGGSVIGRGKITNEEIRFCQAPELLVARLLCEPLAPHEAVIVRGFEVFFGTTGYGRQFRFERVEVRTRFEPPRTDDFLRLRRSLIAINVHNHPVYRRATLVSGADAGARARRVTQTPPARGDPQQYTQNSVVRALVKVLAGFHLAPSYPLPEVAPVIATGAWNIGNLDTDARLSVVVQVVAAAMTGRLLAFFTEDNPALSELARAWLASVDGVSVRDVIAATVSSATLSHPHGPMRVLGAGAGAGAGADLAMPLAPLRSVFSPFVSSIGAAARDLPVARLGKAAAELLPPAGTVAIPLRVRLEKALLADAEVGLRLVTWSTVLRVDAGRAAEVDVADLAPAADADLVVSVVLPAGGGTRASPWPSDARVWFGAHVFAKSSEGPIVGARAGDAQLSLRDLREYVATQGADVAMPLRLAQAGLGDGAYSKMTLRIVGFASDAARATARAWQFAEAPHAAAFDSATLPYHDRVLSDYIRAGLFPFTTEADARRVGFHPSHPSLAPLHAPTWATNVTVPQFAFWMQTGDRITGAAADGLRTVLHTAFDITMARHDWPGGAEAFVALVNKQTAQTDATYDEAYTLACAVMCDTCALLATQMFYKFDETYRVEGGRWFAAPETTRVDVESFHDAMAMRGGDCEDLASMIHRVYRWVQLGDPAFASAASPYTAYGAWNDRALNALQAMAHWYVSGGAVGSVKGARVPPGAGGEVPLLVIDGALDRSLAIGGHMWNVMIPVPRMEALLQRMGNKTKLRNNVATPAWVKFTPVLIGEGTGALYPLVMPLRTYMFTDAARAAARTTHRRRLDALKVIQDDTQILRGLQVQRWSDRVDPIPDVRVNSFYERIAVVYTDDLLLRGTPLTEFWYTRTAPRTPESAAGRLAALPGERPTDAPTWGVDVRDMIMAANMGAYGDGKPGVALSAGPVLKPEEAESFKSRIRQLRPWELPRITKSVRDKIAGAFADAISIFQTDIDAVLAAPQPAEDGSACAPRRSSGGGGGDDTRVNIIFRRNLFLLPMIRERALADIKHIAAKVTKADVTLEYPADDLHSVRLSLWIAPSNDAEK